MKGYDHGLGTSVVHRCEIVVSTDDRPILHVVLPPSQPCSTPISDLRDAGHSVLAFGMLSKQVPECPASDAYSNCDSCYSVLKTRIQLVDDYCI